MSQGAEITRRSLLYAFGFGAAGFYGYKPPFASAASVDQVRQCRPPASLRGIPPPYLVRFRYLKGGEVHFIAAKHSVDKGSSTHVLIRHMFASIVPNRLVIEGYFHDPARLLAKDLDLFRRDMYPENRYALALANELGIRAVGGDLMPSRLAEASLSHGFQIEDVVGTHIVRLLAGQPTQGRLLAVEALVKRDLEGLFPTEFDFHEWYASRFGEPPSDVGVRRIFRGPCGSGIVAKIASFESEARNKHLFATLAVGRRSVARVAAIFGANHLYSLYDSLSSDAAEVSTVTPAAVPSIPQKSTSVADLMAT